MRRCRSFAGTHQAELPEMIVIVDEVSWAVPDLAAA